jgi:c-di-GMP-binding flagellar brake protein YcgR
MIYLILIAGAVGLVIFLVSRSRGGGNQGAWVQFFAKGKDAGFSFKEIELLRQLAVKSNIEDPAALFWSQNQLDICIRSMVQNMRMAGESEDPATQNFLSKLYNFRKKIEIDKPRGQKGIENSRQISEGQTLRILVKGTGVFKSQVVKNTNQYLTLTRPTNTKVSSGFSWTGLKIAVYFWRDDDAGYVFDSEVDDEVFSKGISSLKIAHSDSLFRTQKRKSVRLKMHKPAFLYLMGLDEKPGRIEVVPGLKCFLEDLSDTGCALTVGGKATAGLHIKAQFALSNIPVSMSGIVRSVDFKEDGNRSILHVEADPLLTGTRNRILGEVFGTLSEDEEDLPFRVMDDEMDGTAKPGNAAGNGAGENSGGGGGETAGSPRITASQGPAEPGPLEDDGFLGPELPGGDGI